MKVKIKNASRRFPRLSALASVLLLGSLASGWCALAPGTVGRSRAASAGQRAARDRYRDGAAWISFERTGVRKGKLERVVLRNGARSFAASVGAGAIVRLASARRTSEAASVLRRHRLRLVRTLSPALGLLLVEARAGARERNDIEGDAREDGLALAARLSETSDFALAVPDLSTPRVRHRLPVPPDDPRYGGQWYLERLHIEDAWRITTGSRDVRIAVVDDGCDMRHPDLSEAWIGGRDVLDADDDPSFVPNARGNEHGTACAGIAAASGDNGVGIAGTCPECSLVCIRLVGEPEQPIPLSADIAAFEYAYQIDAAVVSNSWGYAEPMPVSAPLAAAIERVATQGRGGRGAVVVFAAGNENRAIMDEELVALPWVVNVGAVNNFDESAPFGNSGRSLDVSAPTGSLTTDISGPDGASSGDYTNLFGGTSAACPVVAGIAGLMIARAPEASGSQIAESLVRTARRAPYATPDASGHDLVYGYGIVDPLAALGALSGTGASEDAGATSTPEAGRDLEAAGRDGSLVESYDAQSVAGEAGAVPGQALDAPTHPESDAGCALRRGPEGMPAPGLWLTLLVLCSLQRRGRSREATRLLRKAC